MSTADMQEDTDSPVCWDTACPQPSAEARGPGEGEQLSSPRASLAFPPGQS